MKKKNVSVKFIIMITIIIAIVLFLPSCVKAELTEGQRTAIVMRAVQIIEEGNKKFLLRYSQDHRLVGYNGRKAPSGSIQTSRTSITLTESDYNRVKEKYSNAPRKYDKVLVKGADISDTVAYDCSSFVGAVYRDVIGTNFASPTSAYPPSGFQKVSLNQVKPGDILWKKGHVAIYLGDYDNDKTDEIAEAAGIVTGKVNFSKLLADSILETGNVRNPQVQLPSVRESTKQVTINNYKASRFTCAYTFIGQVKEGKLMDVTSLSTSNTGTKINSDGTGNGPTSEEVKKMPIFNKDGIAMYTYWPEDFSLPDEILTNSEGFFHKGMPAYGGYSKHVTPYNWVVDGAKTVLDWFMGFVTMTLKAEIIGWTGIAESLIAEGLSVGTEPIESNSSE